MKTAIVISLLLVGLAGIVSCRLNPTAGSLNSAYVNLYVPSDAPLSSDNDISCESMNTFYYRFDNMTGTNYTHSMCTIKYFGFISIKSPYPMMISPFNYSGTFGSEMFYPDTYVFNGQTYAINLRTVYFYTKEDPNEFVWDLTISSVAITPNVTTIRIGLEFSINYNNYFIVLHSMTALLNFARTSNLPPRAFFRMRLSLDFKTCTL